MADNDVTKMKVADLKRELKTRGLNVTGNKNELVERLQSALIEGDVLDEHLDDTAISEDLLDDNDDVLNDDELEEESSFLNATSAQDEDAILSSPKGSTSSKSPENPSESAVTSTATQAKKVVLKRKLLPSISLTESETPKSTTEIKVAKISEDGESAAAAPSDNGNAAAAADGNVSKLSQMTMKERMELRAKKFGAPATGDAAKLARAERFGATSEKPSNVTSSSKSEPLSIEKSAPNVDLLKKRAERFGGSVSSSMVTIEQKEKLLKRQERFGSAANASGAVKTAKTPISTEAAGNYAEKAKLRLERFKTTA